MFTCVTISYQHGCFEKLFLFSDFSLYLVPWVLGKGHADQLLSMSLHLPSRKYTVFFSVLLLSSVLLSCAVASESLKGLVSNKTHLGLFRIQPEVWVTYWWSHVHQRPATRRWESDLSVIWKDLGNGHLLLEDPVNHDLPRSPNSCLSRRSGTFTFSCASVHLLIEPDWNISCGILRSVLQDYNKCEHI